MKSENLLPDIICNGNAVWIKSGDICLAKFNQQSREYKNPKPCIDEYTIYSNEDTDLYSAWTIFVSQVNKRFGVVLLNEHKPNFIPNFRTLRYSKYLSIIDI